MGPTRWARAPGRVTIIGGHTGDNQGLLISVAIPRYVEVAIEESSLGFLTLKSSAFPGQLQIENVHAIESHWARYVVGALISAGLPEREILKLSIRVTSNLPMQRGLASSAALVSATLFAANSDLDKLPKDELLPLCASVEQQFAGVNCGVLDYYTNLFATEGQILQIDCKHYTHEMIPWPEDISLMVCDTGNSRQLVGSQFNLRRAQCVAVARAAGKASLRDVSQADVDRLRDKMPVEAKRADHVLSEIKRVSQFSTEVRAGNFVAMKALMSAAHRSLAVNYECSSLEQDLLVAAADRFDCCVGSRLTGAGWGGVTIHLVKRGHEEKLATALRQAFAAATGSALRVLVFETTAEGWLSDRSLDSERKSTIASPLTDQSLPAPLC